MRVLTRAPSGETAKQLTPNVADRRQRAQVGREPPPPPPRRPAPRTCGAARCHRPRPAARTVDAQRREQLPRHSRAAPTSGSAAPSRRTRSPRPRAAAPPGPGPPRSAAATVSKPRAAPRTNAVPSVGCPANGISTVGVKMRMRASASSPSSGGSTNTVSDRLSSRAARCIVSPLSPAASVKTATGLPCSGRVGEDVGDRVGVRGQGSSPIALTSRSCSVARSS